MKVFQQEKSFLFHAIEILIVPNFHSLGSLNLFFKGIGTNAM